MITVWIFNTVLYTKYLFHFISKTVTCEHVYRFLAKIVCAQVKVRAPGFHNRFPTIGIAFPLFLHRQTLHIIHLSSRCFGCFTHIRCSMVDGGTCADEKVLQLLQHLIQELEIGRVTRIFSTRCVFFLTVTLLGWEACQICNVGFWMMLVYNIE